MKNSFLIFFLSIGWVGCNVSTPTSIELMQRDLELLASDSLQGREVGSKGEQLAAAYIISQFEDIGLSPGGTDGYIQQFYVKDANNPHEQPREDTGNDSTGITGMNIIGWIDGKSEEKVIIGAHYDHLGKGGISSLYRGEEKIHNGADDNASGTAALIQLAREISKKSLNCDVIFIAFSGEEKGLWGSNYFVKNPTIDLETVDYMINMDMIGRLDTTRALAIHGTGTSPSWPGLLDIANVDSIPLVLKPSGTGPSDHTSFYLQDLPVLHFFTGQHQDYHKPTDDADKINYEGMVAVVDLIRRLVLDLDDEEKLAFTKTRDESSSAPRFTVTLGVVPDYLYAGQGMRIDGISLDKPAEKAGLEKGDVVIQLGDSVVVDMMSYMRALSAFKQGDRTTVIIQKGGKGNETTNPVSNRQYRLTSNFACLALELKKIDPNSQIQAYL